MADVTESYNSFTQRRKDLFGFVDLVVIENGTLIGVQVTSRSNMSARSKKIKHERSDQARAWLSTGATIEVWGWGKKKVGNRMLWDLKRTPILESDLAKERLKGD
jgi:hypothetical protein